MLNSRPMYKLAKATLALPRAGKRLIALSLDLGLCVLTVWLAYYLRIGEFVNLSGAALFAAGASVSIALPIFVMSGLYRAIFRYSGWPALVSVVRAVGIYGFLYATLFTAIGVAGVPRTVGIIQPILLLLFVSASRAVARVWLGDQYLGILKRTSRPKVLIYGAGRAGRQLAAAIGNSQEIQLVGFIDDDRRLHGRVLNGQPIYNPEDLDHLVAKFEIRDLLLAMPSLSRHQRNSIIDKIRGARVAIRTLPSVIDMAKGKINLSDVRELDVDDLLGREPVLPIPNLMTKNILGKVVMVTGAGGSIGSELCRQILAVRPTKLLLVDQSEYALYAIHQELIEKLEDRKGQSDEILFPLLTSVQDDACIRQILSTWRPDTIYHAAAYKHVPLVEHNPNAGIKNNVLGTLCLAQAAADGGVTDFVFISTDKAVRPTNVMGASKRLAEMILQAMAVASPGTKFSIVRFGNVLGSSGSVVPKFRQQIQDGGPITLTHPDVTRYFMTIPEAAQLVVQAGAMARGGDVFVLDMGRPVKIIDLARRIVELSGLTVRDEEHPEGDIEIKVIGLRPGEKLYEELLIGENPMPTAHTSIMRADEEFIPWIDLEAKLNALKIALAANDVNSVGLMMECLVVGYAPSRNVADLVYVEQMAQSED